MYQLQLDVSKEDMLALNDLAGEGTSIREYMSKVIREHVSIKRAEQASIVKDLEFVIMVRDTPLEVYDGFRLLEQRDGMYYYWKLKQ